MKRVFNTVMIFLAAVICASCIGLNNAEPTVAPTPEIKSFEVEDNDCMVLEISATPYNFTFKLWDWDRLGLDGLPRPIHIEDGEKVIQFDRTTEWVKKNLVNHFEVLQENEDYKETRTGLHELEFIESRVYDVNTSVTFESNNEFCMCNLVDGRKAVIESADNRFEPYTVHYAETFIIPAKAGDVIIRPADDGPIKVIKANVRF